MAWFQTRNVRTLLTLLLAVSLIGVVAISQSRPEPSNKETLIVDSISQPETLDPAWSFFTADSQILEQIYEHLLDYKGGSLGEFVPELAVDQPTISDDLLTYTFTLRDDVTFWNGDPLTCADAEYSFERFLAMDRAGGGSLLLLDPLLGTTSTRDSDGNLKASLPIRGVDTPLAQAIDNAVECNGNQLSFNLNAPFPPFLQLMAHSSAGSIYSKAFAMANGAADNADAEAFLQATNGPTDASQTALFDRAMGSGPFRLQVWDQAAEQVILGRYDGYRNGPAAIQNAIYTNVPEFNTRLLRLQRGDADVSYLSNRGQTQQLKDAAPAGVRLLEKLPGFTTETVHMMQDIKQVDEGNQFVGSGQCDGNGIPADFFADIHTRKGFVHSFSQEQFIEDFLQGAGVVTAAPVANQVAFYPTGIEPLGFDLDQAEAEFKAAQCGDAGSVWDVGFSFTAVFNEGNSRRQAAIEQLEFYIESLNDRRTGLPPFSIDVISQPGPVVLNNVFQQQILPMFAFGWSPDFIDIDNWIRQWMDVEGGSYSSSTLLNNEQSQGWLALLNEGIRTVDPARRTAIYEQLIQDYVDNALAVTMPNRTLDNVERSWVNGNYYNPGEGDPQSPPEIYVLTKQADGQPNLAELAPYNPTIIEF